VSERREEMPLRCDVVDGAIDISIGVGVLCFAADNHPDFWDGESGPEVPNIKITNAQDFAREVMFAINAESEDGSTLLTRMLDEAIAKAVESGCDGVDYDLEDLK